MAVYLGSAGCFELRRTGGEEYLSEVRPADVNPDNDRFSFDFPAGQYLTGDMIEITSTDGSLLDFIDPSGWGDNTRYDDGKFFIYVDEAGGMALYTDFCEAVAGEVNGRVPLIAHNSVIPVRITVENNIERIVAQITDYEINTEREAVDVTELGDSFRQQYNSLISGSGQLSCFFEYDARDCDPALGGENCNFELPIYMNQLILRNRIGSKFHAKLTVIGRGVKPNGRPEDFDDEVWYEFDGIVTNVAMAFAPGETLKSTISFITTGEIKLRVRTITNYILQEQGSNDRIELERYQEGYLEQEQAI